MLIRLSDLAPDVVDEILSGRQPAVLSPKQLLRLSKDLPLDWGRQCDFLRFT